MGWLHECGVWHRKWKVWGRIHEICSHYTPATIYTLHRNGFFPALLVKFNCYFYSQWLSFEWYTYKHCHIPCPILWFWESYILVALEINTWWRMYIYRVYKKYVHYRSVCPIVIQTCTTMWNCQSHNPSKSTEHIEDRRRVSSSLAFFLYNFERQMTQICLLTRAWILRT
jgi:hypothetical protein